MTKVLRNGEARHICVQFFKGKNSALCDSTILESNKLTLNNVMQQSIFTNNFI